MTAPTAPAPTAPADAGTPAAPKTLAERQREVKGLRAKPAEGPRSGSFVKVGGKTMSGPTRPAPVAPPMAEKPNAAAKAGAAPAPIGSDNANDPKPEAPAAEKPAPDAFAELKKDRDARAREAAELRKRVGEYEALAKEKGFDALVRKLAEEFKADPRELGEKLLLEHAQKWQRDQELAKLTPEERALHEAAEKWKEHEARTKADAEKAAAAEKEAVGRRSYEATTTKIIDAHKLLPEQIRNHPEFNGRAAIRIKDRLLSMALAADPKMPAEDFLKTVDPAKLAADTLEEYRAELRLALEGLDDAGLDGLLTPKVSDRWTKKLQTEALRRAHPALRAQPRAGDGKFTKDAEKPTAKPLSAMKPAWSNFLPRRAR